MKMPEVVINNKKVERKIYPRMTSQKVREFNPSAIAADWNAMIDRIVALHDKIDEILQGEVVKFLGDAAWVISAEFMGHPIYLSVAQDRGGGDWNLLSQFKWDRDVNTALRFGRESDAHGFILVMQYFMADVPYKKVDPTLMGKTTVEEHVFEVAELPEKLQEANAAFEVLTIEPPEPQQVAVRIGVVDRATERFTKSIDLTAQQAMQIYFDIGHSYSRIREMFPVSKDDMSEAAAQIGLLEDRSGKQ